MEINEKYILHFVWAATLISMVFLIPRNKVREAVVAFLFKQAMTWPLGLFIADMGWIQYPIRFFENVNRGSFTFEYFFYPVICAYFMVYFPNDKRLVTRAAYYFAFSTTLTLAELVILHNTDLIIYIRWNAYATWISLFITFYITRKFCLWFFKPYRGILRQ